MRIKGVALIAFGILFSSSPFSSADATPSPSPDYQTLMAQYKSDFDQYRQLVQDREKARVAINRTFMLAVETANRETRAAMKLAKTAAAKNEILSNQKISITAASVARDAAIAALGSLPTPPVRPLKQPEMAPLNKMKEKKSSPSPTR